MKRFRSLEEADDEDGGTVAEHEPDDADETLARAEAVPPMPAPPPPPQQQQLAPIFAQAKRKDKLPDPLHALDQYTFLVAFALGVRLSRCIVRCGGLGNTVTLDFHRTEGLYLTQVSRSGVAAAVLHLPAASWATWHVNGGGGAAIVTRAFEYKLMEQLDKLCPNNASLSLYALADEPDTVWARVYNQDIDRRIRLATRDPEETVDVRQLMQVKHPRHVRVDSRRFNDEVQAAATKKAVLIALATSRGGSSSKALVLYCSEENKDHGTETTQMRVPVVAVLNGTTGGDSDDDDVVLYRYSMSFLQVLLKMTDVSGHVDVAFGLANHPMVMHFHVTGKADSDVIGSIRVLLMDRIPT